MVLLPLIAFANGCFSPSVVGFGAGQPEQGAWTNHGLAQRSGQVRNTAAPPGAALG